MGGLVSRSYIQSSRYRGDVERLITLGTPHRGSPNAYRPWQGGEVAFDPMVNAVLNVYLWYLRNLHPFQTELNRLKTIRTQIPGLRDLLPTDNYLIDQASGTLKNEDDQRERNLWVDILNAPEGLNTLFGRVPVTVISSRGFYTLQKIVVGAAPFPPANPPVFPDGTPVDDHRDGDGDGTVPLASAQLGDGRAKKLEPVAVAHADMPDRTPVLDQVFAELSQALPLGVAPPTPQPRLVILTASPVQLSVEMPAPAGPAEVLGAGRARRPRRTRRQARDYGHAGKHLNILVVPQPATGAYNVRLHGTATGSFALGAMIFDESGGVILGAGAEGGGTALATTEIVTVEGRIATDTDLYYTIEVTSMAAAPAVRFDVAATARDVVARMGAAVQAPPPDVLGGAPVPPPADLNAVLGAAGTPDMVRERVDAALARGDQKAVESVVAMLADPGQRPAMADLLNRLAERMLSSRDAALANALAEQLKQIVEQG
jgi:hypothetical protein